MLKLTGEEDLESMQQAAERQREAVRQLAAVLAEAIREFIERVRRVVEVVRASLWKVQNEREVKKVMTMPVGELYDEVLAFAESQARMHGDVAMIRKIDCLRQRHERTLRRPTDA